MTASLQEKGLTGIKQVVYREGANEDIGARIRGGKYDIVVCVGPEASRFVECMPGPPPVPLVYTMLFNPGRILPDGPRYAGVSLNIPLSQQFGEIRKHLKSVHTVGMLFNPARNQSLYLEARDAGEKVGLEIFPIAVRERGQISTALRGSWHKVEAIWFVPDQTVISESIVRYIIKESLLRNVPTIGYNRFFADYGAAFAFVIDYAEIGRQTADVISCAVEHGHYKAVAPAYGVMINNRVLDQIEYTGVRQNTVGIMGP